MVDREKIAEALAKDMDSKYVEPPAPGKFGEYIKGFRVFLLANEIFGWDGWSYRVDRLEVTNNAPEQGRNKDQWAVGYLAIVTVTVDGVITKQDVGHGQGHSRQLGDAHDSAAKEAVTDALKRALRTFGNPLGLALYDKTKAHVSDNPDAPPFDAAAVADRLLDALRHTADCDLKAWKTTNEGDLQRLYNVAHDEFLRVSAEMKARAAAMSGESA